MWRAVALTLWIPLALVAGPVLAFQDNDFGHIANGLLFYSVAIVIPVVWVNLYGGDKHVPAVAGFVLGFALMLSAYGHVDRAYVELSTDVREVVVTDVRDRRHGRL